MPLKEYVKILNDFEHVMKLQNCKNLEPNDFLPRSSTIQRFIEREIYYENEHFDNILLKFDSKWLLDTGVTLGKGREAIVRLMMIGGHEYVAVKIVCLSKSLYPKVRFQYF